MNKLIVMMKAASKRQQSVGNLAAIALMLFLWLGTCALAASPELHRLIHKDAQAPVHNCLVTQLQQHSLLTGFVAVAEPIAPAVVVTQASSRDFELFSSFDYRLS